MSPNDPKLDQVYKKQIAPLWAQIEQICKDNGIPAVAAFYVSSSDKGGAFALQMVPYEDQTMPRPLLEAYHVIDLAARSAPPAGGA